MTVETTPPNVTAAPASRPRGRAVPVWVAFLAVVVAGVLAAALTTDGFLTTDNLRAILQTSALTGIVAVAMTPLTLSGNFGSLSTQQSAVLAALLFAYGIRSGWGGTLTLLFALAVVIATGVVQGLVVAAGLNPIITTLAAGSIMAGAAAVASSTTNVSMAGNHLPGWVSSRPLGIPVAVLWFLAVTVVVTYLSKRTVLGRRTTLMGANRETALLSGIPLRSTTVCAFVVLAVGVCIAGMLGAAQVGYANTLLFPTMTFDVIGAVVVGGAAVRGGYGSPAWSAGGAVLISTINDVLLLHSFGYGSRVALVGALVVVAIVVLQLVPGRRTAS